MHTSGTGTNGTSFKFWLEDLFYMVGQVCYTLGECLAAVCYFLLLVCNMLSSNLHNDTVDDERQRLYEEQKRQRLWDEEEREQREFEERQRQYALRFGNWQVRHLAAITTEEREEADTLRNSRGVQLAVIERDGSTQAATSRRVEQMKFEVNQRRQQISRLYSEVDYFRYQERLSRDDERHHFSKQIGNLQREIACLERLDQQSQLELQHAHY